MVFNLSENTSSDSSLPLNPTLTKILEEFFSLQRFLCKATIGKPEHEINFIRFFVVLYINNVVT